MSRLWRAVRRFLLWDYPRAGWQYDVMVGLILAFIFLTPRGWFRDQPRQATVVQLAGHDGVDAFWIAPELLVGLTQDARVGRAKVLIGQKLGRKIERVRLDEILDAESEVTGYMALIAR